jgi:hypothetical protein
MGDRNGCAGRGGEVSEEVDGLGGGFVGYLGFGV